MEKRLGSRRYEEDPTDTWDDGSTETWDDVIAGHKNQGSSSEFDPVERTGKKTRKNPRLEPDSKLFSNSDEESDSLTIYVKFVDQLSDP